jgi:integrase
MTMASVANDPGGKRRVIFTGLDGKRRSIHLGETSEKNAADVRRHVEELLNAAASGQPLDLRTADWLSKLSEGFHGKLIKAGLVMRRDLETLPRLAEFIANYISKRIDVKPGTRLLYRQTEKSLVGYFQHNPTIDQLTEADLEDWNRHLAGAGYSENTRRKWSAVAKLFFGDAVKRRLIDTSPAAGLKSRLIEVTARQRYLSVDDACKLMDVANAEWAALIVLARFCATRTPSETCQLRWSDLDAAWNWLTVRSPKTAHEGKDARRVPVSPIVRERLQLLWDSLPHGAPDLMFPRLAGSNQNANLRTQFHRLCRRAGLAELPKPWNNLRSSCVTDWADVLPSHAVCAFAGHSEAISRAHYRQVTSEHVERLLQTAQKTARLVPESTGFEAHGGSALCEKPAGKVQNAAKGYSREDSNL